MEYVMEDAGAIMASRTGGTGGTGTRLHDSLLDRHICEERRQARDGEAVADRDEREGRDEQPEVVRVRQHDEAGGRRRHRKAESALLAERTYDDADEHALHEHATQAHSGEDVAHLRAGA